MVLQGHMPQNLWDKSSSFERELEPTLTTCYTPIFVIRMTRSQIESYQELAWQGKTTIWSASEYVLQLLQSTRIEYQGQYSLDRLRTFQAYATNVFTTKRLAAVLFMMPWPSIIIIVLMELAPLNPPSSRSRDNTVFWIRFAAVSFVISVCYVTIAQTTVHLLELTFCQVLCTAGIGTAASTGTANILATVVGFPVPFTMVVAAGPWLVSLWLVMGVLSFRRIFANPEATLSLKEWVTACAIGSSQLIVYPLYNYAFRSASPTGQTGLSIILGTAKAGYRYFVGKTIKLQSDYQPEIVTYNVEIAHAIFLAFTMQNASSIITVGVLLMIDLVHAIVVIYDVNIIARKLHRLDAAIRMKRKEPPQQTCSVIDRALALASCELIGRGPAVKILNNLIPHASDLNKRDKVKQGLTSKFAKVRVASSSNLVSLAVITPMPAISHSINIQNTTRCVGRVQDKSSKVKPLNEMESEYVATTLHLLHLTEYTMLGELVEVVVPIIYTSYVGVMIHLPNRVYCSQLSETSVSNIDSIALRMLSYGFMELVSLILLDKILRNRLGFSPAAQLAMVLETRSATVHAAFVMWVVHTVQALLDHYGADFSFQFAWLHNNTTNA